MDMTAHDARIVAQFTRWAKPFADLPIHAEADAMERTIAACALSPDVDVLDVACGPGILACALAPHARSVVGIDITPAMIDQARLRQAASALDNIDWRIGNARSLPFEDRVLDRVTTRYSLHHMTDPASVLREMKRVCRPGGRIVVVDATPSPETRQGYDRMEKLRDPSHTRALTLDELRRLGRDVGLREVLVDFYRLEAQLDTLSDAEDMPGLRALFDADIAGGHDTMGIGAWRAAEGIRFRFPLSIVAWDA